MALTYGFFDAINGDRAYNSLDFGRMFDGVINDGILMAVAGGMKVTATTGMVVSIAPGRAWYGKRWAINDSAYVVTLDAAHATLARKDIVVISLDDTARLFKFEVVKGTPAANPVLPSLREETSYHQYALAYITVPGGASSIVSSNVEDARTSAVVVSKLINGYPMYPSVSAWNIEVHAGSVTPSITLPAPDVVDATCEIRYIFTAATTSATFTAPAGYILGRYDFVGLAPGNTLSFTNLAAGSIYEASFAVLDSIHIGMVMTEWPTV